MIPKLQFVSAVLLLLCSGYGGITSCIAQETAFHMLRYDLSSGMPDNFGRCGLIDSRGILWVGTQDGLASFDGRSFRNYFHNSLDSNSLQQNFVVGMVEDKTGGLWITTVNSGLSRYNPVNNTFTHVLEREGIDISIPENYLSEPYIDGDGLLWVGTYRQGFFSYNRETHTVRQYNLSGLIPGYEWDTKTRNTTHFFADDPTDGNLLWITAPNGLYRLEKQSGKLTHIQYGVGDDYFGDNFLYQLYFRGPHELWICSWGGGLKRYDTRSGQWDTYVYDKEHYAERSTRYNILQDITPVNDTLAWVTTGDRGIGQFNFSKKEFTLLPVDPVNPRAVPEKNVKSVVPAKSGQWWFISYGKGIFLYDPANRGFTFRNISMESAISESRLRPIEFAADTISGIVYAACNPTRYLYTYDLMGRPLEPVKLPGGGGLQNMLSVLTDHRGEVWTSGRTIHRYDPVSKKIQRFTHPVIDSLQQEGPRSFFDMIEDRQGNIWLIGTSGGLISIDSSRQNVTRYRRSSKYPACLPDNIIISQLLLDNKGRVWIVHEQGLTCFDPAQKQFVFHDDRRWGRDLVPLSLAQDEEGHFWLGTEFSGLLKLHEKQGKLELANQYQREHGFPSEQINSIVIDQGGLIWMATPKGVLRFHPFTRGLRTYGHSEGIADPNIYGRISHLAGGFLYVGQTGGFCVLDLQKAYSDPYPPRVVLHQLKVFGKALPLDTMLDYKELIRLDYQQDFFTIEYAGLTFSQASEVQYAYKLKGYDAEWVYQPVSGTVAVYTGVKPGNYMFMVKAANSAGVWSEARQLKIIIVPPFWQTWWFYLLCVLAAAGIILYLIQLRIRRVRVQERIKAHFEKQLADMELKALRSQMNPHFIFNCLNSIKHLIMIGQNADATLYLTRFAQLIRKVLNHSANEKIPLSDELETVEIYVEMERLRFDNQFCYQADIDPGLDLSFVEVPPLILQPFVENAIWHGLLHKEGEARLTISIKEDDGYLLCMVDDNGVGRARAAELGSKSAAHNKSFGLSLTANRLKLLSKLTKINIDLEIIDKTDEQGRPSGTTVQLKIPLWIPLEVN